MKKRKKNGEVVKVNNITCICYSAHKHKRDKGKQHKTNHKQRSKFQVKKFQDEKLQTANM